jgi:hypothetical protein
MEVFIGIILFFIIFWYGLKLFLRYGLPFLLTRFMKNQQSRYGMPHQRPGQNQQRPDGEVSIKKNKSQKSRKDDDFGEYVDFEDVKE